jgi:hypothetical protein
MQCSWLPRGILKKEAEAEGATQEAILRVIASGGVAAETHIVLVQMLLHQLLLRSMKWL